MPIKERRRFMRIGTQLKADFFAKGASMASGEAQIQNFSREGLGVLFHGPIRKGEHVDLTLKLPGDNTPILATGEVTWTQPSGEKSQSRMGAGLKFRSIKPLDLARLLDFVYSRWLGVRQEN